MNLTQVHADNVEALKVIYNSLTIICKVFYSLNFQVSISVYRICSAYIKDINENLLLNVTLFWQDLPEFFEDNMEVWMRNFHTLLNANVPALQTTVIFINFV